MLSHFRGDSRSRLVSLLSEWADVDAQASRQDAAQQWSAWLGPLDAIALSAAHQAVSSATMAAISDTGPAHTLSLDEALQQLRADLIGFIRSQQTPVASPPRGPRTGQRTEPAPATEPDYASYRQRYLEIERRMEWRIAPFRLHCRRVLSQTNTQLKQLAELDAAMEQLLTVREEGLLTKVPALLERRFKQWKKAQLDAVAEAPAAETTDASPVSRRQVQRAPDDFEQDFQNVMLAEMHFRLEPVLGLVEAFAHEA